MPETQSIQDRELLEAFGRGGSEAAFERIVERHARWVYAAAFRQLRDRHLAEDATQAVFLLLVRKRSPMGNSAKLSGWLFNSVRYVVRGLIRAKQRRERREREVAEIARNGSGVEVEWAWELDAAVEKLG